MKHHSLDEDLRAITATRDDWHAKVQNFEDDLSDSNLRGDTRIGIRNMLNNAYSMVEQLETQRAELVMAGIDRDREREEYGKILAWCKQVREEREELTYTRKRDFLRMIGACVIVEKREKQGTPVKWDIKMRLPQIEEIIYQGRLEEIAGQHRKSRLVQHFVSCPKSSHDKRPYSLFAKKDQALPLLLLRRV